VHERILGGVAKVVGCVPAPAATKRSHIRRQGVASVGGNFRGGTAILISGRCDLAGGDKNDEAAVDVADGAAEDVVVTVFEGVGRSERDR
jgi:hypothetical protein